MIGFTNQISIGGGCLVSVRDYAKLTREDKETRLVPRQVHPIDGGRILLFDVWDFEGDYYQITTYILEEREDEHQLKIARGGKYFCVEISTLESLFLEAGFQEVSTLRDCYFQPLIVAKK